MNQPEKDIVVLGHVLIVEDHDDIRHLVGRLLKRAGYHVSEAINGAEGLERLNAGPLPDLILLDLMMPIMDGFAFSAEFKKNNEWQGIPIVTMSADSNIQAYKDRLGAKKAIKKPLDIHELLQTVASLMPENS